MAKQENKSNGNKEDGNKNPQPQNPNPNAEPKQELGNTVPLNTQRTAPYPQPGVTPDMQPERYENLRKKFPDLIDSDFSGTREQVIQRVSQRKGITPLDAANIIDGR